MRITAGSGGAACVMTTRNRDPSGVMSSLRTGRLGTSGPWKISRGWPLENNDSVRNVDRHQPVAVPIKDFTAIGCPHNLSAFRGCHALPRGRLRKRLQSRKPFAVPQRRGVHTEDLEIVPHDPVQDGRRGTSRLSARASFAFGRGGETRGNLSTCAVSVRLRELNRVAD